jgi:hypothetical protein
MDELVEGIERIIEEVESNLMVEKFIRPAPQGDDGPEPEQTVQ